MSQESNTPVVERTTKLPAKSSGRGFVAAFALDFRAALLMFMVDIMVFGGDAFTLGLLIPIGICVGAVLAFITYKIQIRYAEDDHDAALIKSVAVGLLTAIPTPVGPFLAVPAGIFGLVTRFKRS
jgi:hypothetical protein